MTGLLNHAWFRIGAAVVALGAVAGAGVLAGTPAPDAPEAETRVEKVVVARAALGCPTVGADRATTTAVNAAVPALPEGTPVAPGRPTPVEVRKLGAGVLGTIKQRGRGITVSEGVTPVPVAVRATGPLAAGTAATVTSTASSGVNRGIASTACATPSAEFWFAGAGSAVGRRDVLVLTNLDDANASVDVTFYGAAGQLENSAGNGIVVRGRSQAEVYMRTVVPGQRELAMRVVSTGGRIAAAIRDNVTTGPVPAGVDWLSPSAEPARETVLPAVAPGAGARVLTVVNPGDLQTTATVNVLSRNGRFRPAGRDTIVIPAGGIRSVRLDEAARGEAAAVAVSAEEPVFAALRIIDQKNTDFASLGSTMRLTGPSYLVLPPHADPATLILTAPGDAGSAHVELRSANGSVVSRRTVKVKAGSSTALPLAASKISTYLAVSPGEGGGVAGAVTLTPSTKPAADAVHGVAAWPLTTSLVFRAQLGAHPDVRAALRPAG
ncbi:MAG: DUF5719 family protein [Kribbellaceae bacterium]